MGSGFARQGSDLIVQCLETEGVKHVFGLPGTAIADILDALYQQSDIQFICARHEQAAAFMAEGYAHISGRPGVCLATRGAGAAYLASGVQNAFRDFAPVLALTGQNTRENLYRDSFEELDAVKLFAPLTKWSIEIPSVERIPDLLQRAYRLTMTGKPRPVHVALPVNVQKSVVDGLVPAPPRPRLSSLPCPADLQQALRMLVRAQRPLLLLGGGVLWSEATPQVVELAERYSLPVLTACWRGDAFPEDHPLSLGSLDPETCPEIKEYFSRADLILAIGTHFSEFATGRYTLIGANTSIIQLDSDPEEIGRIYPVSLGLVGDAREVLQELLTLSPGEEAATTPGTAAVRQQELAPLQEWLARQRWISPEEAGRVPIQPRFLMQTLRQALPRSGIMVNDCPTARQLGRPFFFLEPRTHLSQAGGSMGTALPMALGAKLAAPDRDVICLTGDGSFMMVLQELETAVRCNLPVVVVVDNNQGYGNIRSRCQSHYGGRCMACDFPNPDFAALARLFGAWGERVEKPEELLPALKRSLAAGKPAVVDVLVDPETLGNPPPIVNPC